MQLTKAFRFITPWVVIVGVCAAQFAPAFAADVTEREVRDAIERARRYLLNRQNASGSWTGELGSWEIGVTSLATLALLNCGMTAADPEIRRALEFLREAPEPTRTYEISLMIMALSAAKDGPRDRPRIASLVQRLERTQLREPHNPGMWDYGDIKNGGDNSNTQFAVLALKEAQDAGVPVSIESWRMSRKYWERAQGNDGSWGYHSRDGGNGGGYGSMTVAGITSLVISGHMLRDASQDLNPDGSPNCCSDSGVDLELEKAIDWIGRNFAVSHNPKRGSSLTYYLYGLERAGRLSGRRFFVDRQNERHDWYREGAEHILKIQKPLQHYFPGVGHGENCPVVSTSFCLLFLSKGNAPVVMSKLEYRGRRKAGLRQQSTWNLHADDVRNLTHHITTLPKWPRFLNWQTVELASANVDDLRLSPVCLLTGKEQLEIPPEQISTIRQYLDAGGLLFAVAGCDGKEFDIGFRELIRQLYPGGEARLRRLPPEHSVYRAEYLLDPESVELWGVEVGCRTSVIYSPIDIACLWNKWTPFPLPGRKAETTAMITKALQIGVNIIAYASGREPLSPLSIQATRIVDAKTLPDSVERGFLQIAKIRHNGGWDSAPNAVRNLLVAINSVVGKGANNKTVDLTLVDPAVFKYPLLYMHGRYNFTLSGDEVSRLREYLNNGGVLFADSCCTSEAFDRSFRAAIQQVYPDKPLERIPVEHPLYSSDVGYDIKRVRRRDPAGARADGGGDVAVRQVEPGLEGIAIDGRFVVIYSKYDISCALEQQTAVSCPGYVHEDAVKLAVNAVLYALWQ